MKCHYKLHYCSLDDLIIIYKESIGTGAFASVHWAEYKNEKCAAKILSQHAKNMMIEDTSLVQPAAKDSLSKGVLNPWEATTWE